MSTHPHLIMSENLRAAALMIRRLHETGLFSEHDKFPRVELMREGREGVLMAFGLPDAPKAIADVLVTFYPDGTADIYIPSVPGRFGKTHDFVADPTSSLPSALQSHPLMWTDEGWDIFRRFLQSHAKFLRENHIIMP